MIYKMYNNYYIYIPKHSPPIIVLGLGERISFLDGKSDGDFRERL